MVLKNLQQTALDHGSLYVLKYSFNEIDLEVFSTVILFLPLIQERQLSVSGERMCTSTG